MTLRSAEGQSGTLVTYTPQGPTYTEASLPVPVVAGAGTTVALTTIFAQTFGTEQPGFYSITLLPTASYREDNAQDFWRQPEVNAIEGVKLSGS
jgi:hypothetical protein